MSKIINNINLADLKQAKQAVESEVVFLPTPSHRRAKVKFWARYDNLYGSPDQLSAAAVESMTQEPSIPRWFSSPGFKEWFFNKDEAKEREELIYQLGLDKLEALFLDQEANHNAVVNGLKTIAMLTGKLSKNNDRFTDEDIQRLPPEKLRAYILKHAVKFLPPELKQAVTDYQEKINKDDSDK